MAASAKRLARSEDMSMNIEVSRKKLDLSSAIAEGDIRVLLMVLVHLTGDERWLEPPYKPTRDVRLIPDPQAGMPKEIQAEIRAAVLKLFENGEPKPVITDPGDELMLKMMRATLGESVTPEYAPLMREEMGFIPREARWTKPPSGEKLAQQHVLIVGAGVCAIALGVALGRLGIPYTIVEKNAELGGTWYVNRYPGCGVDTPNHSYSFSFGARNRWTRYFAQRQELLDYLKKVAVEHDVRSHIRFNTRLASSRWDEPRRRWISNLETGGGPEEFESTTLVSAIGQLNDPSPAHFKGEADFSGLKLRSDLIAKCVPTYPPYGKRILLDNGWFRTLTKPNVELVTDKIDHFERDGIVTTDGKLRPADVIVISTGFKVTEMAARLNISGRDSKNLRDVWANDNPTAYLGLTVPDFPNFFCMLGPNSGPAHGGSVIFQSECQSRYIAACLVEMIEHGIAALDVSPEAHDRYVREVDKEHEQLIWTHPGMTTYYRNSQGRVFSAMPWRFVDYWEMTHDPDLSQYRQTRA